MKKVSLFLSIILLSISFLSAQFEGKVKMKNSENDETMTFLLKDNMVKLVPDLKEEKTGVVLMNGESGDITIIMGNGEEKLGMKMNLNSNSMFATQMRMAMENQEVKEKTDVKLKWTGETQTVNGQKCEKVIGTNEEGEFTAWIAKGLGLSFGDLFPIQSPMTEELKAEMFGDNSEFEGFPMRIITKNAEGKEQVMDATVEKTSISKSEMTMEKGVEIFDMDNIMKEIMAAQNDPDKMQDIQKKMERFQKMMGN